MPGLAGTTGKKYMYNITCEPQPGMNGRTYSLLAAHVVGGGTVVNGMAFDRGSAGDYDLWEDMGNPGWGWKGLFPYFKKVSFLILSLWNVEQKLTTAGQSETYTAAPPKILSDFGIQYDPSAHGSTGPVQSSMPTYVFPATSKLPWL